MFGWEFPPHIAGGLGTASYGLTRGLAKHGIEVIFVVPKAYGDEDQRFVRVVNASEIETPFGDTREQDVWEKLTFIHIDSNMVPYVAPEEFDSYAEEYRRTGRTILDKEGWTERYSFSGKYGANLMEEVARYAMVAAQVARDLAGQFDLIHAHDWLTYYAGIAAKRVSGKPLVVHMHATEFDRSGEHVNPQVYEIERAGMTEADRVIAVSNLTRNIVIEKYGIPASKVVTVHNAVRFSAKQAQSQERGVSDKIVTFLGRITYQKGPDYFVEAAAKVLRKTRNVRFVMAGSGDMLKHIVRRVAKLGIADRFHFTGFSKETKCSECSRSATYTSCRRSPSRSASRRSRRCGRTCRSSSPSSRAWPKCSTTRSRSITGMSTRWPTPSTVWWNIPLWRKWQRRKAWER